MRKRLPVTSTPPAPGRVSLGTGVQAAGVAGFRSLEPVFDDVLAGFGYQIMHVQRAVLKRMTGTG